MLDLPPFTNVPVVFNVSVLLPGLDLSRMGLCILALIKWRSIVGAVSPPGGDFSDPVTSATLGIVQVPAI